MFYINSNTFGVIMQCLNNKSTLRILSLAIFLICSFFTDAIIAQWSSDSTVNNPICTAFNYQKNPQLTSDGNSGAIIVWEDNRIGDYNIYSQLISSDGHTMWTNDGVSVSSAVNDQVTPQITSDENGGAIIVWQDNRSGNADIYAQRIDNNGVSQWTADGIPICVATNQQFEPIIIRDGSGGAIITWKDYRSGFGYDIYAQRVNNNGDVLWSADGNIICSAGNEQSGQQIISDGSGNAIIVWQDNRAGGFDIYAQKVDGNGTVVWDVDGIAVCIEANDQQRVQIASDGVGGALIAWDDYRNAIDRDIYAQRLNSDGVKLWTSEGVPVCLATGDQLTPQSTSDNSNGAIIVWNDLRAGIYSDLFAQRIDLNGNVLWTANGVDICTEANNQNHSQIVSDKKGGAIIVWQDHRRGFEDDIYAQSISTDGNVVWMSNGVPVSVPTLDQAFPRLIFSENNNAIIAWEDFRNGNYDIYCSLVDTNGILGGGAVYVFNDERLPNYFSLLQNYPNPFNPVTNISYTLPSESQVKLSIYNPLGELVETLVNEKQGTGKYDAVWNAGNHSSGIYIYTLDAVSINGNKQTKISKKMILMK